MCKTVKERLIAFIEFKGLSKNKFEMMCGLSKRYVSNISKSIQPEICKKISLVFPDLNTGWLMTGDGEMLKAAEPTAQESNGVYVPQEFVRMFNNMTEMAKIQEGNIAKLTAMVDRLTGGEGSVKKDHAG